MLNWFKTKVSNIWASIKKFFKDSEVIFAARATAVWGVIQAGLYAVDWQKLLALDFTNGISQGQLFEAGKWIVIGIVLEYLRKRRATDL